ncbi:Zn-dependent hydrolase [Pseudomonas lactucae]|uniref:Zn-dependent hydrolase n=1 Tax=Pseudomonas lactucae TaxID=2813360 RepID=A0A9X0Y9N6_9PSED|nr:Zn-dependent hydrolase [Pseudomonas lactucae]MBN2975807.1 Zn-dependent hydrolase [Pseudomonas lactucae]MBN2985865.1 Zn-dependent hydrolase [Pseudomonas lactucae]
MSVPLLQLNIERLWNRVNTLSNFTLPDVPWTRRAFSPEFEQARLWLRSEFESAGLSVTLDAGGNLIGQLNGSEPDLKPLISGSHCDTVVGGGRFDGIIGVLAALEVAHALKDAGRCLRHSLQVIDFLSEEPSDYGISCVGSRAFAGQLSADMLASQNRAGESLAQAMKRIGGAPERLDQALREPGSIAAFVELHIEQGPVLESQGLPIGSVTNIVGIRRVGITVCGLPDHAGTTPMDLRRDALVGAAELIREARRMAIDMSGRPHYVVATVGRLDVSPNVPNAVPGKVDMVLEVRSDSKQVLLDFPEQLLERCNAALTDLRLTVDSVPLTYADPTDCSPIVIEAVSKVAEQLGLPHMTLPSGAGHDAVYVGATGPMGMVFVPCLNGRSHCPEEWLEPQQLLDGTQVLAQTLIYLDGQLR